MLVVGFQVDFQLLFGDEGCNYLKKKRFHGCCELLLKL